jgi:hypothetical protein
LWDSPIYKFKAEIDNKKTEILIDVTGSAPNFAEPKKQLEGAFEVLLAGLEPKNTKILDFGAAKLRNTWYLLEQGYQVYACEFADLFNRSEQANEFQEKCRSKPNFHQLIFPKDFIDFKEKFDVVLLINVLNIMPRPIERYYVLTLSREKMKEDGRLLWYTQHGNYSVEDAVGKLGDGMVTGKADSITCFIEIFREKKFIICLQPVGSLSMIASSFLWLVRIKPLSFHQTD